MITLCNVVGCNVPEASGGLCIWHIVLKEHADRAAQAQVEYLERRPSDPERMDEWWRHVEATVLEESVALRRVATLGLSGGQMVAFGEWIP